MRFVQAFTATALMVYLFSAKCEGNIKQRNQMKAMTGEYLRIVAYHEPPIFSIIRNAANESLVRYVGFPKEVFDLLSKSMNFTYSFVEVTPTMVKRIGSIDAAMIDQLLQKNADINGRLITPTAERLAYMDFTTAVSVFTFAMIQPMPQIHNRFLAPIKPFQPTVWYLIFVALAATALTLSLVKICAGRAVEGRGQTNVQVLADNAWYALVVITSQGGYMQCSRLSMRFAAGSWCLIAFVLVYAYNSTLVSYISLSKYESVVNTWQELAASSSLRVTVPRGSISADIILNSKTGALKTLGDSLRRNPDDLLLTLPGELERVLHSGCCAHVEVKRLGEVLVYKSMMEHQGECRLTIGKELDYSQVWSFGVAKHLPHLSTINKGLQRMRETGLYSQITRGYYKSIGKCLARQVYRPKTSQLTLYDMAGSFIVLGLGCSLSLITFLVELSVASRLQKTLLAPSVI
ncbi:uncharacterized protein LOC130686150 [Daphnia carinata]|uniref:uncharacterized protein LOC130686150 n=1 Tax=Daphnia carinata TaxID=120202 RepID=UPI00257A8B6A|nr:uncharacterized protein LOC130686150 [Daphnia carinata]